MNRIFVAAVLMISLDAGARPLGDDCKLSDYQAVSKALDSESVTEGAQYQDYLNQIIVQEIGGPACRSLVINSDNIASIGLSKIIELTDVRGDVYNVYIFSDRTQIIRRN